MEALSVYIPMDRRQALARGEDLPNQTSGTALFADISGFTPLTEALVRELGPRRGADELTRQLNIVYDALIHKVHQYRGSVITFSGDAITCWFDADEGLRATACGLAMQQTMKQFSRLKTPAGTVVSLAIKVAATAGPVRRFWIGDPQIQYLDVLAGTTLDRVAAAEHQAGQGDVIVGAEIINRLGKKITVREWRHDVDSDESFAVVAKLTVPVTATPWPDLPNIETDIETGEKNSGDLSDSQARPWLLPPVYERIQSGQGQFLAEIRPAVAFFLKFSGLDFDQDEAVAEKLAAYIHWVQNILVRYESYLLQLTIGDKGCYLYGAIGAPVAHEDDAARAVAAALELQSLPPEVDFITGVQIGISQGRMRAGAYGGSTRRTYGVLGDEVNTAARLMGQAKPGQILVGEHIVQITAQSYHFADLGRIRLKGKQNPFAIYSVIGKQISTKPSAATLFNNPLVGRDDELAHMNHLLTIVLKGTGQILSLEGVAGVGKSHLAAEFAEQAARKGFEVAIGACQSTSQDIAYYPWRQIAHSLFNLTEPPLDPKYFTEWSEQQIAQLKSLIEQTNPDWLLRLPLLGDLLDLPIPDNPTTAAFDPRLRQEALFALAIEIIQTRTKTTPLFLMIEDGHWMDEASQNLVIALARVLAGTQAILVLVHRPPVSEDKPILSQLNQLANYHHLDLGELSAAGVAALVTNRLQGPPSALALPLIQTQAQGNPFFAEELVDNLCESGGLVQQADGVWTVSQQTFTALRQANCLVQEKGDWVLAPNARISAVDLGLPDSIHGIVLSRIDRLPETHKVTLKVASVIGRVFEFEVLNKAHPFQADSNSLLEQITVLEGRDFARLEIPQPRLTHMFKHNITRDVVYDTMLEEQLQGLHQAVGDILEKMQPDAVERLAYHYSHSDYSHHSVREKTLFYLDKAAHKTQREYANETALSYYSQALALEERWTWRKGHIEVLHVLGYREEEKTSLERLAADPNAPPFEVAYLWGQFYEATGDYPQAQGAIKKALKASQVEHQVLNEARCLAKFGAIAHKQGEYDQAKDWYNQALTLFQKQETHTGHETRVLATTLNGLGVVHRQQGDFELAQVCHERALALSQKSGDRRGEAQAFNDLGAAAFYRRQFAEALSCHQQALDTRRAIGDRAGEGTSLYNMALTTQAAGDYTQTEIHLSAALAISQAIGNRWDEANIQNALGIHYQELGDLPQAQIHLERALQVSQEIGDEGGRIYILGNLGLVVRDLGNLEAAETQLSDGLALAKKQADNYVVSLFLSHLAIVSLLANKLEEAIERANQALTMRRELDLLLWTTADLATLAAAYLAQGNIDQAMVYAQQTLAILDECGGEGPELPQRDYFICYQVLMATDQPAQAAQAQVALRAAYDLVMARGQKITDPALRHSYLEQTPINRDIIRAYTEPTSR